MLEDKHHQKAPHYHPQPHQLLHHPALHHLKNELNRCNKPCYSLMNLLKTCQPYYKHHLQALFHPEQTKNWKCLRLRNRRNRLFLVWNYFSSLHAPIISQSTCKTRETPGLNSTKRQSTGSSSSNSGRRCGHFHSTPSAMQPLLLQQHRLHIVLLQALDEVVHE